MTEAIFIVIIALEDLLLLLSRYLLHRQKEPLLLCLLLSLLPTLLSFHFFLSLFLSQLPLAFLFWQLPLATMFMLRNGKQRAFHAPPNPSINGHIFCFLAILN